VRTYGTLSLVNDMWVIDKIEPHVAIKLKHIFPKIPKHKAAPFSIKTSDEACLDLEWFAKRYPLEISEHDRDQLAFGRTRKLETQEKIESFFRDGYVAPKYEMNGELRHYQAVAVEMLLASGSLLCGDDVGLGKTVVALGAASHSITLPMIIVVQTHLPRQWLQQVRQFLPKARVHVVKGTRPYTLPEADIHIIKYSCLAGWVDVFNQGHFKSVVFDEVQELRLDTSQKYAAAKVLVKHAKYVLGLSATPIYNHAEEIFNICDLIRPGCLSDKDDFFREWAFTQKIAKDPQALGTYLRENHIFLRRTRAEVGRELPPVNKIVHTVDYDEKAVDAFDAVATQLAIAATTGTFHERGMAARELDMRLRQITGVAKAKGVAQAVKVLLENGESVLLAGWHRDVYSIWNEELAQYNPVMYTGSESESQKDASRKAFINGDTNLMFISLRSGVGLDGLQKRCSIVAIGELDWSPEIHKQLIGRLDRDGQETQVTALYLVSNGGSDPPMVELLGLKASQAQAIIDPLRGVEVVHSDVSRLQAMAQKYLNKKKESENAVP
jgi:superfamily II DNA or RNA helicase